MSRVWGLVDDRAGHTGQVLGVIAKLGQLYTLKNLEYNLLAELPSALLGASLLGVERSARNRIAPPWPSLVIAAGRRTIPVLRYIKKHSPSTHTVYLMKPDGFSGMDLIAAPKHDGLDYRANLVVTTGPLHAVTQETLVSARSTWQSQFSHLPKPWVALCLGGTTKHGRYSASEWTDILKRTQKLVGEGSLLITTSRRTPQEAVSLCETLVQGPHLLHRWHHDKDNPYLGILACADAVVVTGDSMSMCAEAAVTGKPVLIASVPRVQPQKYQRFHNSLFEQGLARALASDSSLDWAPNAPLDDAGKVAYEIRARFPQALS